MSHELRTPLTAILGLSESLQMSVYGPLTEKQTQALQTIQQSGEHLLALITDILDLSKVEAGKMELKIGPVAVEDVCQASLRIIREVAHKKNLEVAFHLDKAVTALAADERRLKQMLVNLLSNAVKFTPEGGALGLAVTGEAEGSVVRFTVWDTGIGIAPQNLGRLFKPFVQLDSDLAGQYSGTGLGLSLVARMAELHGGSVAVESDGVPGRGSRFSIVLPWAGALGATDQVTLANQPTSKRRALVVEASPEGAPHLPEVTPSAAPVVLVADDNRLTCSTLKDYLEGQGYRVEIAHQGGEALERARETHPAIILMDIQMPNVDGLEAIRRLRAGQDQQLASLPIIALTALTMPGDRERCLEAGANDYMSKPVNLQALSQVIQAHLNQPQR
jgi:CheY-like chemotaxis protein